jgi:flavin reductase (DIM6/NTAB) family NADH-FMN oxidoreductase RutF
LALFGNNREVQQVSPLGTYDMFMAGVVNIMVDDRNMDEKGAFSLAKALPLVYNRGHCFGLGRQIGKFGWSVKRKKRK